MEERLVSSIIHLTLPETVSTVEAQAYLFSLLTNFNSILFERARGKKTIANQLEHVQRAADRALKTI